MDPFLPPSSDAGRRPPAPGRLELLRTFMNTVDLESGEDDFSSAETLAEWLTERGLLARGTRLTDGDRAAAIAFREARYVFLGNIDPVLQFHVRQQLPNARLVALDSMNYWITGKLDDLKRTLADVHVLIINEGEAKMLSGVSNLKRAAATIREMGPQTLVFKRGEHGASLFTQDAVFSAPALPLDTVQDPTGAGDTFAGGFMGHLAKTGDLSEANLRRAVIYGSVMASFAVEEFGLGGLLRLSAAQIAERFHAFKKLTHFDV